MIRNSRTQDPKTCAFIQDQIAAYREGWLSPEASRAVSEHLAACPVCSAHLRMDEALVSHLDQLAPVQAPVAEWSAVVARRRVKLHVHPYGRVPLLAWAGAAAILVLAALLVPQALFFHPAGPHPISRASNGPAPVVRVAQITGLSAQAAHALASASSVGDDPNRAILLGYTALQEHQP